MKKYYYNGKELDYKSWFTKLFEFFGEVAQYWDMILNQHLGTKAITQDYKNVFQVI